MIEKGGVAYSAVHGAIPDFLKQENKTLKDFTIPGHHSPESFFATGISIVIHPVSPMVPIIHMNVRYFETDGDVKWFGGGIDLTPHYINEDDAIYFHSFIKKVCDRFSPGLLS